MEKAYNSSEILTINEAVKSTGKSISSIYRLIKSGKLKSKKVIINGKEMIGVKKDDIIKLFPSGDNQNFLHDNQNLSPDNHTVKSDNQNLSQVEISEKLLKVMEEFFEKKQAELVKPMEQQSLYLAGSLSKENQFLKDRLETLLQENREMQDRLKTLPEPADIETQVKELNSTIQEKEQAFNNMQVMHRQEVDRLKAEGELREKEIADRWRVEVETLKKPWYKFW
jgi:hypothetical protein